MNGSVSERYSEADEGISALYEFLTDQVENGQVSTQNVPDEVHEAAIYEVLEGTKLPEDHFRGKKAEDVELILSQYSHDSSQLAQAYLDAVRDLDNRREHDRRIDASIQDYLEGSIEQFDVVFRETEVKDQDYSPEETEVETTGRRHYNERPTTDADFWAVNLDEEEILFQEEKSSQSYQARKERQLQDIEDAVEAVNEEIGTDYTVEAELDSSHNLTETIYPMPNVYEGDIHLSDGVEERSDEMQQFKEFVDNFLHKLDYQDLEPITDVTPDYAEAL